MLFPNWLITMLLLGLLIFLTYKTTRKAWSLHRSEVKYLAQRAEQRPRPAASQKRVSAAKCPAMHVDKTKREASSEGPNLNRGSAAPANDVAGQAGTHVGREDIESDQDMQSISMDVDQPGPSRQFASLEVEGLPEDGPSGGQSKASEHGLLCGVVAAM